MDRAPITKGYSTPLSDLSDADSKLFEESLVMPSSDDSLPSIGQTARTYYENIQKRAQSQTRERAGLTTRDLLGTRFAIALQKKEVCIAALADAERVCLESECLLRQFLGEAAVQEVKQEHEAGWSIPIGTCLDAVIKPNILDSATIIASPPH